MCRLLLASVSDPAGGDKPYNVKSRNCSVDSQRLNSHNQRWCLANKRKPRAQVSVQRHFQYVPLVDATLKFTTR